MHVFSVGIFVLLLDPISSLLLYKSDARVTNDDWKVCFPALMFWCGDTTHWKRYGAQQDMFVAGCMTWLREKTRSGGTPQYYMQASRGIGKICQKNQVSVPFPVENPDEVSNSAVISIANKKFNEDKTDAIEWLHKALISLTVFNYHVTHSKFVLQFWEELKDVKDTHGNKLDPALIDNIKFCRNFKPGNANTNTPFKLLFYHESGRIGIALGDAEAAPLNANSGDVVPKMKALDECTFGAMEESSGCEKDSDGIECENGCWYCSDGSGNSIRQLCNNADPSSPEGAEEFKQAESYSPADIGISKCAETEDKLHGMGVEHSVWADGEGRKLYEKLRDLLQYCFTARMIGGKQLTEQVVLPTCLADMFPDGGHSIAFAVEKFPSNAHPSIQKGFPKTIGEYIDALTKHNELSSNSKGHEFSDFLHDTQPWLTMLWEFVRQNALKSDDALPDLKQVVSGQGIITRFKYKNYEALYEYNNEGSCPPEVSGKHVQEESKQSLESVGTAPSNAPSQAPVQSHNMM